MGDCIKQDMIGTDDDVRVMVMPCTSGDSTEQSTPASSSSGSTNGTVVMLQHPKSGGPAAFLIQEKRVCEINWFKQRFSSWFIGDNVVRDGGLFLCTPIDFVFVCLPWLDASRQKTEQYDGRFCDAEQILTVVDPQHASKLTPHLSRCAALVCDVKLIDSTAYYRLNDSKVMAWLACKLEQTAAALRAAAKSGCSGTTDAYWTAQAAAMLSEYLSSDLHAAMCTHLNITPTAAGKENMSASDRDASGKVDGSEQTEALKRKQAEVLSTKAKAELARDSAKKARLAKDAAGSKKLSAFFGRK